MAPDDRGPADWPLEQRTVRPRRRRFLPIEVGIWVLSLFVMTVTALAVHDAVVHPTDRQILGPILQKLPFVGNDPFGGKEQITILLVGTDQAAGLCDTIMLGLVNRRTQRVALVSFPRDFYIETPTGHRCKINEVVNRKLAEKGTDIRDAIHYLQLTLERNFGVVIDSYARVDVQAFVEMVDAIGGVDIEVPKGPYGTGLHYDDNEQNLHIHLSPGLQHLDGYQAMGFVRWRQHKVEGGAGDGDEGRVKRQQQFLQAVAGKVAARLQQRNMESARTATALAATAFKYLTTDLTVAQIAALAGIARHVDAQGIDAIRAQAKGAGRANGMFVFYPDRIGTNRAIRDLWIELGREKPLSAMARIEVLNGCGISGIADKCRNKLVQHEFRVVRVGNATTDKGDHAWDRERTSIRCAAKFEKAAEELRRTLGLADATVVNDLPETSDVDISIILGTDYKP